MGRYPAREEEIDQMLRAHLFVDLYGVVRQGLRASVESDSINQRTHYFLHVYSSDPFLTLETDTPAL